MIGTTDGSACGEHFRTLYKVARTVNSSLDVMQVLNTIVISTAEALNAKACSLRLLGPDGQHLLFGAAHGLRSHYRGKGSVSLENSGVDRLALSSLAPIHIPDVRLDERFQYPAQAREEGIVSVLVVPLIMQDEPIGVMRVYSGTERVFSEAELALADYQAATGSKEPQLD